jgi:ribose 5-phosphate isomerase A
MTDDEPKRSAARRAAALARSGMVLGLGSGSTAGYAIDEIGRRLREGTLRDVLGIPTSVASERRARAGGIPLTTLERHPHIDLTIDGADEVDPSRRLIKGAGGALLREKIVATASARLAIVIDPSKRVERLGTRYPVPVEVVEFGWTTQLDPLRALGGEPLLRMAGDVPYRTDQGNLILDVRFASGIAEPDLLAREMRRRAGVVETGLFLGFAPEVIVGEG